MHPAIAIADDRAEGVIHPQPSQTTQHGDQWDTAQSDRLLTECNEPKGLVPGRSAIIGSLALKHPLEAISLVKDDEVGSRSDTHLEPGSSFMQQESTCCLSRWKGSKGGMVCDPSSQVARRADLDALGSARCLPRPTHESGAYGSDARIYPDGYREWDPSAFGCAVLKQVQQLLPHGDSHLCDHSLRIRPVLHGSRVALAEWWP